MNVALLFVLGVSSLVLQLAVEWAPCVSVQTIGGREKRRLTTLGWIVAVALFSVTLFSYISAGLTIGDSEHDRQVLHQEFQDNLAALNEVRQENSRLHAEAKDRQEQAARSIADLDEKNARLQADVAKRNDLDAWHSQVINHLKGFVTVQDAIESGLADLLAKDINRAKMAIGVLELEAPAWKAFSRLSSQLQELGVQLPKMEELSVIREDLRGQIEQCGKSEPAQPMRAAVHLKQLLAHEHSRIEMGIGDEYSRRLIGIRADMLDSPVAPTVVK